MYSDAVHLTCTESSDFSFTRHSQAQRYSDACHVRWFPASLSLVGLMDGLGRKEILEGMLGANLVCFQTYSYSRHFTSTCVRVCGYETTTRCCPCSSIPAITSSALTTLRSLAHPDHSQSSNFSDNKYIGIDVQGHIVCSLSLSSRYRC
jgi:hypothetical protein